MVDLDTFGRGRKIAVIIVAAVLVVGAGFFLGRLTSPRGTAGAATAVSSTATAAVSAPYTAPSPAGTAATTPPDGGQGWTVPAAGAGHGPALRSPAGVPYGYTEDVQGAALAAVNAVVGGRWLKQTFRDPWSTLGFLAADPAKSESVSGYLVAAQDGVRELLGPDNSTVGGNTTGEPTPPAAAEGARVIGVKTTLKQASGQQTAEVEMLWATFSFALTPGTVRMETLLLDLIWQGDWKVGAYQRTVATLPAVTLKGLPAGFPLPAEGWRE